MSLFPKLLAIFFCFFLIASIGFFIVAMVTCNSEASNRPLWDILAYFPSANGNASRVTWAHAVNSKDKLRKALNSSVMMLEADVILRSAPPHDPVMAHPPANDSDLTLAEFLSSVSSSSSSSSRLFGIKLDFKQLAAVAPSVDELIDRLGDLRGPVVLNADILEGPGGGGAIPVPAGEFLDVCSAKFGGGGGGGGVRGLPLLSVGWTTGGCDSGGYTWRQVREMRRLLLQKLPTQSRWPVTFPIRACLLEESMEQLTWLCEETGGGGVTVWGGVNDRRVTLAALEELRRRLGVERVFVDLPPGSISPSPASDDLIGSQVHLKVIVD